MRVLLVTNLYPTAERPELGVFVRDQLEELCQIPGADVELFAFPPGKLSYPKAVLQLRRYLRRHQFDLIHAHYGLCGWVAQLAGASPIIVTFHGTDLRHRYVGRLSRKLAEKVDLVATVSQNLFDTTLADVPLKRPHVVLPCGANLDRFTEIPRSKARAQLGLDTRDRYVLFPADPARPEKRFDRATVLMREFLGPKMLHLGGIDPDLVPLWINAADAVIVPSDYEGFGLAVIEALACNVPVISTPVGIAPIVLPRVRGTYCQEFDLGSWCRSLGQIMAQRDPRVDGRKHALQYTADKTAQAVFDAWQGLMRDLAPVDG